MVQQRVRLLLLCRWGQLLDRLGMDSRTLLADSETFSQALLTLGSRIRVDLLRSVRGLEDLELEVEELPWPHGFQAIDIPGICSIPAEDIQRAAEEHSFLPIAITVSSEPETYHILRTIAQDMLVSWPEIVSVGDDLYLGSELWTSSVSFGNRTQAMTLVGCDGLSDGQDGHDVVVMVVDQGFNAASFGLANVRWFDVIGQESVPGQGNSAHGAMIVRNVLAIAPHARFVDVPLIPAAPPGLPASVDPTFTTFSSRAVGALSGCFAVALLLRHWKVPCVVVNAWGIFNTAVGQAPADIAELKRYSVDRAHAINKLVALIINAGGDVVFSAGNCGQFAPDPRCGENDRGPERSILGAASLEEVITAGAVRVDTTWLGYSSQGHGQSDLGRHKPDFCAPTQFCENYDPHQVNSGTSAAAAIAAGAIAALRSGPPCRVLTPAELQSRLIQRARAVHGGGWDPRYGFGLLDAAAASQP